VLLGAVTDWSQLGGRPGKINPVGTAQMQPAIDLVADLIHLDPGNLDAEAEKLLRSRREAPNPISILPNRDELFDKIAGDRNAITIQFPHIPPSVKALRLGPDAKKFTGPDADTIKSKLYPLAYESICTIQAAWPPHALVPASTSLEMEVTLAEQLAWYRCCFGAGSKGPEWLGSDEVRHDDLQEYSFQGRQHGVDEDGKSTASLTSFVRR
jgi:hypothetical protein